MKDFECENAASCASELFQLLSLKLLIGDLVNLRQVVQTELHDPVYWLSLLYFLPLHQLATQTHLPTITYRREQGTMRHLFQSHVYFPTTSFHSYLVLALNIEPRVPLPYHRPQVLKKSTHHIFSVTLRRQCSNTKILCTLTTLGGHVPEPQSIATLSVDVKTQSFD